MPPVIAIIGRSNAGKTTLLERLIAELKSRGRRVASVKHDVHGFDIDQPGKDSYRHAQAGADAVVISSPDKLALIRHTDHDWDLQEVASLLGEEYDVVLAEGYKQTAAVKIEVHRKEIGGALLCRPEELLAVVTDEDLELPVWQYSFDDIAGVADVVEGEMAEQPPQKTSVRLDSRNLPLSPFVQDIIASTLAGMLSALKGVEQPGKIEVSVRAEGRQ